MKNRGVTLTELIVVISVIGILAVALGFSYQGWMGAYKVEKTTKELYSDLMNARAMAVQRNRNYFVDFPTATSYRVSADTAAVNNFTLDGDGLWDADGNGVLDPVNTVLPTFPKRVEYTLTANGAGIPGTTFTFDKRGLISPLRTICIFTANNPDYDCIIISQTRINMGNIINQGNACDANNCNAK